MEATQPKLEPVGHNNFESASLDQWQKAFYVLYGNVDQKLPLYDIMLQMVADSARIAEAMRRGSYHAALNEIPKIFSWLCSMTSKVARNQEQYDDIGGKKSLADLIWNKYPGVCAFCAEPKCHCPALHVDAMTQQEREKHLEKVKDKLNAARQNPRPTKLNDWVQMFEDVYGTVNASRSSAQKTFHFLEEIGEVEVELRKADRQKAGLNVLGNKKLKLEYRGEVPYAKIEWEDEVADVFSWLTAVYLHLKGGLDDTIKLIAAFAEDGQADVASAPLKPIYSFANWVWRAFENKEGDKIGLRCHRCHKTECDCTMLPKRR
jgi:hypothetical protein